MLKWLTEFILIIVPFHWGLYLMKYDSPLELEVLLEGDKSQRSCPHRIGAQRKDLGFEVIN